MSRFWHIAGHIGLTLAQVGVAYAGAGGIIPGGGSTATMVHVALVVAQAALASQTFDKVPEAKAVSPHG